MFDIDKKLKKAFGTNSKKVTQNNFSNMNPMQMNVSSMMGKPMQMNMGKQMDMNKPIQMNIGKPMNIGMGNMNMSSMMGKMNNMLGKTKVSKQMNVSSMMGRLPRATANKPMPNFPNMPVFSSQIPTSNSSKNLMNQNKNKSYSQLKKQFNIHPFRDSDKDGIMNYKDCRPFDNKKHYIGIFKKGKDYTFDETNPEHTEKFGFVKLHKDLKRPFREKDPNFDLESEVRIRSFGHRMPHRGKKHGDIQIGVYNKDEFDEKFMDKQFNSNLKAALKDHLSKHGSPDDEVHSEFTDDKLGYVKDFINIPPSYNEKIVEPRKKELKIKEVETDIKEIERNIMDSKIGIENYENELKNFNEEDYPDKAYAENEKERIKSRIETYRSEGEDNTRQLKKNKKMLPTLNEEYEKAKTVAETEQASKEVDKDVKKEVKKEAKKETEEDKIKMLQRKPVDLGADLTDSSLHELEDMKKDGLLDDREIAETLKRRKVKDLRKEKRHTVVPKEERHKQRKAMFDELKKGEIIDVDEKEAKELYHEQMEEESDIYEIDEELHEQMRQQREEESEEMQKEFNKIDKADAEKEKAKKEAEDKKLLDEEAKILKEEEAEAKRLDKARKDEEARLKKQRAEDEEEEAERLNKLQPDEEARWEKQRAREEAQAELQEEIDDEDEDEDDYDVDDDHKYGYDDYDYEDDEDD